MEALRIGDPATSFLRAMRGCSVEKTASGYACAVFGRAWLQKLMWRLPYDWVYRITEFDSRVGLRGGYTVVWCSVNHDRIEKIGLLSIVGGRYESLGMRWEIADRIPARYDQPELSEDDRRTYMHWFHITSTVSGEGFAIYATSGSTEKELRARHLNRECLFSFRGCDGLCELLPDAIPVLNDRKRAWGGCSSVPASHCELKNDECRNGFPK